MADVLVNTPARYNSAADDRLVYIGGNGPTANLWAFQISAVSSWDGAITVQRRVHDDHPTRTAIGDNWDECPYQKLNEGGTVSDGAYHTDTITGTANSSQILVDATGADIALSIANRTTGSVTVRVQKRRG